MPNLRSCDKGTLKPNSKSFDYKSYSMTPSTSSLKSTPLIYAPPNRNNYLISTFDKNAYAHSNLILSFGNCKTPFVTIDKNGNLLPTKNNTIKFPIRQIATDQNGNYYYSYFGKNYKVKNDKNGIYFQCNKKKIYI